MLTAYVGTNSLRGSQGIYTVKIREDTAEMRVSSVAAAENSAYLCLSKDGKYLYAAIESEGYEGLHGGGIAAYRIAGGGELQFINKQPAYGSLPCFVDVDEKNEFLYASVYGDGALMAYPLGEEGEILPYDRKLAHLPSAGKIPHVHCSKITPDGEYICAADCGIDAVAFYYAKGGRRYELAQALGTRDRSGPRHIVFRRNLAYLICETNSYINVYQYKDTAPGKLVQIQEIKTLPEDYAGWSVTSALRFSRDGGLLFASNRGHNSIACYRVDSRTGKLALASIVPLPGSFPRDFNLTPDGRFLIVGLQHDDKLLAYEIDELAGTLKPTGQSCAIPSPCCILFDGDFETYE